MVGCSSWTEEDGMLEHGTGRNYGWSRRSLGRALVSAGVVAMTLGGGFSASAQSGTPAASPAATSNVAAGMTFGLIQKSGDQQYFKDQEKGFTDVIQAAGGKVLVQDVKLDADAAISAMDTMIGAGVKGIAITVPDQAIGPAIAEKAKAAKIPLIALDDNIKDSAGAAVPFAGFDGADMGTKVGEEAVKLWQASKWGADGVGALSIEVQSLSVCMDRTNASRKLLTDAGFPAGQIQAVPYDGTAPAAIDAAATIVTAHPEITKWIVFACNDEGVQGGIRALESAGVTPANTIGVGLGAYLACPEWKSGNPTGFKAALYINGVDVGSAGANALLDAVTKGTPLPANTIAKTTMTTPENYKETGVTC